METPLTDEEKKARRAEINRANAQKSTGPRTSAGKANSRRNGLKHGRHSEFIDYSSSVNPVLLPGESMVDYSRMLDALMAKIGPRDHAEKEIIYRLAASQWESQRFRCIRLFLLEDKFQTGEVKVQHEVLPACAGALTLARAYQAAAGPGGGLASLRLEIAAAERSIAACYRELKQLRSFDPFDRPPANFNPATDIAQQTYTSAPKPEDVPPAAPAPTTEVFENTESEPTETPENSEIQSQPKPSEPRAEHGYSIVLPPRRAPQRAEPVPKVRTAAG
ncbi:MAG: hypothetical protein NTV52_27495 [Acidobacteria bacterium]|nr:hypothetical protein [Acidobacteriota bacterium]